MKKNTCRTCKFWGSDDDVEPIMAADHKWCNHEANGDDGNPSGFGHEVQHGSFPSGYCSISTGPDFGCVHYVQKVLNNRELALIAARDAGIDGAFLKETVDEKGRSGLLLCVSGGVVSARKKLKLQKLWSKIKWNKAEASDANSK